MNTKNIMETTPKLNIRQYDYDTSLSPNQDSMLLSKGVSSVAELYSILPFVNRIVYFRVGSNTNGAGAIEHI